MIEQEVSFFGNTYQEAVEKLHRAYPGAVITSIRTLYQESSYYGSITTDITPITSQEGTPMFLRLLIT